jgi:hypothetical protein
MTYRIAADAVVVVHFAFIAFVVFGALLAARWRWLIWLHLPTFAWGVIIETTGRLCPLTDIENALRARAGQSGYPGGFIEHYLLAIIYPAGLTREIQLGLAVGVFAINAFIYGWLYRRWRRRQRSENPTDP